MNAETFSELLPAYALGSLSEEDRTAVEAFLATSHEAQAELRTYQSMLADFALLVPRRQAPAHLTDDFRRRLAAEAASPSASTGSAAHSAISAVPPTVVKAVSANAGWRRRDVTRLILGIAAVLVVAIGVLVIWRSRTNNPDDRQIQNILSNPVAMVVTLNPAGQTQGKVSFVTVPNDIKGVVVADLPPLPAGKQYQLWLIKDKTMDSAGVFDPSQSPSKQILLTLPKPASSYTAVGLTVEPSGGSPAPTTSPIFVGNFD